NLYHATLAPQTPRGRPGTGTPLPPRTRNRRAAPGRPVSRAVPPVRLAQFRNVALTQEDVRSAWGWVLLEQTLADIRYGFRAMRRSPALTAIAVLSLALGIGANTAIFSLVDAVLLRTLPVDRPEELERV